MFQIPFAGLRSIRVLDFSRYLPGPFCTKILADLGCRVTKLELPHWLDPVRALEPKQGGVSHLFQLLHSGKKTSVFDFNRPEGRKRLLRLLEKADVVVEGFRPGLMKRLGLDYAKLKIKFPGLIYCSLTGYGQKGPWRRRAGHDLNFVAVGGLLSQGGPGPAPTLPPTFIADFSGGLYAAIGILAALLDRRAGGRGRRLDIAMAKTSLSWALVPLIQNMFGKKRGPGESWWNGRHPFYNLYQAKDGRFLAVGAVERGSQASLLGLLGLSRLIPLLDDLEGNGRKLQESLRRAFLKMDLDRWTGVLSEKEVCVTPVLEPTQALRFLGEG